VRHVHKLINTGHGEIVDADLSSYFDTLPHSEAKAQPLATGRLKPLRLFSTPHGR